MSIFLNIVSPEIESTGENTLIVRGPIPREDAVEKVPALLCLAVAECRGPTAGAGLYGAQVELEWPS